MSQRRGCWFAIARCFNSKPNDERTLFEKKSTNTIEFENLVTAEQRENEARRSRQVVTEVERDYAMSGKFDQLVEEQRRIDEERDAELRRQEEALRQEQEAYYAAKREAAKRSRHSPQMDESTDQSQISFNFPTHFSSSLAPPTTTPTPVVAAAPSSTSSRTVKTGTHSLTSQPHPWHTTTSFTSSRVATSTATSDSGLSSVKDKDDIDFDEFLENVKARQQSMSTSVSSRSVERKDPPVVERDSDSEEEIDFGFWEKASPLPMASDQLSGRTDIKEVDLNLL